jgi:hypothetical protein
MQEKTLNYYYYDYYSPRDGKASKYKEEEEEETGMKVTQKTEGVYIVDIQDMLLYSLIERYSVC